MSDDEDEEVVIVCWPVAWIRPGAIQVPGRVERACSICGQAITLAPTGQKIQRERKAILTCMPCGTKKASEDPDAKLAGPTDEQIKEIRDTLNPEEE